MVLAFYTLSSFDDALKPKLAVRCSQDGCAQQAKQKQQRKGMDTRGQHSQRLKLDFAEGEKEYQVLVNVPGVAKEHIKIDVDGQALSIAIEEQAKTEEQQSASLKWHHIERVHPIGTRVLRLPEDADTSKIGAKCESGVLTVTIPKREPQAGEGPRRITIN